MRAALQAESLKHSRVQVSMMLVRTTLGIPLPLSGEQVGEMSDESSTDASQGSSAILSELDRQDSFAPETPPQNMSLLGSEITSRCQWLIKMERKRFCCSPAWLMLLERDDWLSIIWLIALILVGQLYLFCEFTRAGLVWGFLDLLWARFSNPWFGRVLPPVS